MAISILARTVSDPVNGAIFIRLKTATDRFGYLCAIYRKKDGIILDAMKYEDFLLTTYWRIIRDYLYGQRGQKCERCGRTGSLRLHHLTYDHHGEEHLHLDDLIFLCKECHEEKHNPVNEDLKKALGDLVEKKKTGLSIPAPIENPDYDSRTILNLHDYGDIRGRNNGI